jgi:hypothetical protein
MALIFELLIPIAFPQVLMGGDPWGIPSIYPSAFVSIAMLVVVSYLTPAPKTEELKALFPKESKG